MDRKKHLETILILVLALGVFYWFSHFKNPVTSKYLLLAALILGLVGVFVPVLAEKIHWTWMKLAQSLGWVMNKVLLSIVFFIFLLPVALLAKAFRKGTMKLKSSATSYYKDRNFLYDRESLEQVW